MLKPASIRHDAPSSAIQQHARKEIKRISIGDIYMVRLRLRRVGRKKQPSYRLVAADKESPRDGRFLEVVGFYNPRTEPSTITLKEDRIYHWLSQGAQPSDAADRLFSQMGLWERYKRFKAGEKIDKLLSEAAEVEASRNVSPKTRFDKPVAPVDLKKPAPAPKAKPKAAVKAEAPVAEKPKPKAKVKAKAKTEAKAKTKTKAKTKAKAKTETKAKTKAKAKTETKAKTKTKTKAKAKTKTKAKTKAKTKSAKKTDDKK
jgi:small subunit ribosomal protein S16